MKIPRLILLPSVLFAFLVSQARAGDAIVDWKFGEAQAAEGQVKLMDRSGNGYDLLIPAGAKIESDAGSAGGKALVFDGNLAMGLSCDKKLVAMPTLQLSIKAKPSEAYKGGAELVGAASRWSLRYMGSRQSFVLVVYLATDNPGTYVEVECKAEPGSWNAISAQVNENSVLLRVGLNQSKVTGQNFHVFGSFDPVKLQFMRPLTGFGNQIGGFVGSVSDFTLGLKK